MSTSLITYINNAPKEGVMDKNARVIELNYDRDKAFVSAETNIGKIRLSREANDELLNRISSGLSGGPGALEGIPYREELIRGSEIEKIFDGYIDLTQEHTLSKDVSEVTVKEKESIDFLNDVVDGFSFEYLESIGLISSADYEYIPYVLNSIPNYVQSLLAALSVYVVIEQLRTTVNHIAELAAKMANPFETVTAIIQMILLVAYLFALFISLVKLVNDVFSLLIQPVKYHACMSMKKQLEIGAQFLGYGFESPIFDDPLWAMAHIIPEKLFVRNNNTDSRIFGFTAPNSTEQKGYFKGTYGDLLRAAKTMFKGKVIVKNGKIILLRRDQGIGTPQYQLANESSSDYYQPKYEINANEFVANYVVKFETDVTDKNTIQEYTGTSYQVITRPLFVEDQKLVLMKGLSEDGRIPFALAKTKTELSVPEKILKAFFEVVDDVGNALIDAVNAVISVYNGIVGVINKIIKALDIVGINVGWEIDTIPDVAPLALSDIIENRIGMLKIENDDFATSKIFIFKKGSQAKYNKIHPDNATKVSAKTIWHEFHFVDSFAPSSEFPNGNQCIFKRFNGIPFTFLNYQQVKQNNMIYDFNGNEQELVSLKFYPLEQKADVYVRFSHKWTNNITQEYIEPNGA